MRAGTAFGQAQNVLPIDTMSDLVRPFMLAHRVLQCRLPSHVANKRFFALILTGINMFVARIVRLLRSFSCFLRSSKPFCKWMF